MIRWCMLAVFSGALAGCGHVGDDDATTPDVTGTPEVTATPAPAPTPSPTPVDWTAQAQGLMAFWTEHNLDTTYGGYYTGVGREGNVTSRRKWTRSVSREVYGFAKAFQLTGDLELLDHARGGVDFLLENAYDSENGGFYEQLDETGEEVVSDARTMFNLAYALTGLAAFYEVTHDPEVGSVVEGTYDLLSSRAWDSDQGGYYKELSTDMSVVVDYGKDFNALVDPATAMLFTLYAATGLYGADADRSNAYKERLLQIGMAIVSHLIDPDGTGWIGENFTKEWEYDPDGGQFGDRTICGHNLKAVWTLLRVHLDTSESIFLSEAEDLLNFVMDYCSDEDLGGIYDMIDRQTNGLVYGEQKAWWQQEQGMLATQLMAAVTGKSYYQRLSDQVRGFYVTYFPDLEYGEVYATLEGDGAVQDPTKGNEWKSAYHSIETAYFSHLYDSLFERGVPVTLYYYFEPVDVDRYVRLAPAAVPYGTYVVDDPATLDGEALALQIPSQIVIAADTGGLLAVVYRPVSGD